MPDQHRETPSLPAERSNGCIDKEIRECRFPRILQLFHGLSCPSSRRRTDSSTTVEFYIYVISDPLGWNGCGQLRAYVPTDSGLKHRDHGHGDLSCLCSGPTKDQVRASNRTLPPFLQHIRNFAVLSHPEVPTTYKRRKILRLPDSKIQMVCDCLFDLLFLLVTSSRVWSLHHQLDRSGCGLHSHSSDLHYYPDH